MRNIVKTIVIALMITICTSVNAADLNINAETLTSYNGIGTHEIMVQLNSPELFEQWFANNFTYDWNKFWITTPDAYPQSPERSIRSKKGICFDAAYLAYKCLKQAGHDVTCLNVYFAVRSKCGAIMHSVCIVKTKKSGKVVYYKIADTNSPGYIQGPFINIRNVAEYVAQAYGVPLKEYTEGLPSYHYSLFNEDNAFVGYAKQYYN